MSAWAKILLVLASFAVGWLADVAGGIIAPALRQLSMLPIAPVVFTLAAVCYCQRSKWTLRLTVAWLLAGLLLADAFLLTHWTWRTVQQMNFYGVWLGTAWMIAWVPAWLYGHLLCLAAAIAPAKPRPMPSPTRPVPPLTSRLSLGTLIWFSGLSGAIAGVLAGVMRGNDPDVAGMGVLAVWFTIWQGSIMGFFFGLLPGTLAGLWAGRVSRPSLQKPHALIASFLVSCGLLFLGYLWLMMGGLWLFIR